MKLLVITADDLGYSEERDRGIAECFQRGLITHTSLMVNGVAVEHAVKLAKQHNIPIGLHFNISEGIPVAEASKASSLVNSEGVFLEKLSLWEGVKNGKLDENDIRVEFRAQLEKFRSLVGQYPSHVDGHQHVHIAPGVCHVFADVMKEYGVKSTRLPIDVSMETSLKPSRYSELLEYVVEQSKKIKKMFLDHGIRVTDCFFGLATMGRDMSIDRVKSGLQYSFAAVNSGAGNSVGEFMVHPGNRTRETGGCGTGPDEFSQSPEREHEMRILADPQLLEFYQQEGIKLTPWTECWE